MVSLSLTGKKIQNSSAGKEFHNSQLQKSACWQGKLLYLYVVSTINTNVFGQICAANKAVAFPCQKPGCNIEHLGNGWKMINDKIYCFKETVNH